MSPRTQRLFAGAYIALVLVGIPVLAAWSCAP